MGAIVTTEEAVDRKLSEVGVERIQDSVEISTKQMDVTTPITTVPTTNPLNPTATEPRFNPTSIITNPANPMVAPVTTNSPGSSSRSWCVASQSVSKADLQVALDYACGQGGSDCSAIQPGGSCFIPDTLHWHASYAFNCYYKKNPIPTSCNFGGTAVTTSTDPRLWYMSICINEHEFDGVEYQFKRIAGFWSKTNHPYNFSSSHAKYHFLFSTHDLGHSRRFIVLSNDIASPRVIRGFRFSARMAHVCKYAKN